MLTACFLFYKLFISFVKLVLKYLSRVIFFLQNKTPALHQNLLSFSDWKGFHLVSFKMVIAELWYRDRDAFKAHQIADDGFNARTTGIALSGKEFVVVNG